jgi:hypothetical protein
MLHPVRWFDDLDGFTTSTIQMVNPTDSWFGHDRFANEAWERLPTKPISSQCVLRKREVQMEFKWN